MTDLAISPAYRHEPAVVEGRDPGCRIETLDVADPAAIVDRLTRRDPAEGELVVVVPSWDRDPLLRCVRTARLALADARVVVHELDLPPLAGGICLTLAAATSRVRAGRLLDRIERAASAVTTSAWLGSVTGLHRPAPSVVQHALSWLPWTRFGVRLDRPGQPGEIVRLRGGEPLPDSVVPSPPARVDVVVAVGGGVRGGAPHVSELLARSGIGIEGETPVVQVPATSAGARWWGTEVVAEIVVVPSEIAELLDADVRPRRRCGWCRGLVVAARCPLCGHVEEQQRSTPAEPTGAAA